MRSTRSTPLAGLRLAVDATMLDSNWSGAQRAIFELTRAMAAARPEQPFSVLVGPAGAASLGDAFAGFDQVVLDVVGDRSADAAWRYDLVLRGMQFFGFADLDWIERISTAFVVRQLDFIAQVRPDYHSSPEAFEQLCTAGELGLRNAAGVIWISHTTERHAAALGLDVGAPVRRVIYEGLDHVEASVAPSRPIGLPDDRPFILQLGNAFQHKNRVFSMRLAGRLRAAGWPGRLVLAGAYPTWGASQDEERALRAVDADVDAAVVDLGFVGDAERDWLIDHAVLGLFPSEIEGFGLPPFEFARRGVATISSRCYSLDELQPPDIPHLGAVDDLDSAVGVVRALLDDPAERARVAGRIDAIGRALTWERSAYATWEVLEAAAVARWPYRSRVQSLVGTLAALPAKSVLLPSGSRRQRLVRSAVEAVRAAR